MRWGSLRRSPRPSNRKRQRAFGARHSLFRVHFYISIPLSAPPLRNSWIRHWYKVQLQITVCLAVDKNVLLSTH